jgi:hypothetical protein
LFVAELTKWRMVCRIARRIAMGFTEQVGLPHTIHSVRVMQGANDAAKDNGAPSDELSFRKLGNFR